jgi:hypothetical protein
MNLVPLNRDDRFVTIYLNNGQKRKEEWSKPGIIALISSITFEK